MIIKMENSKKSERGIEVTGWVPDVNCERVTVPNIPRSASIEERNVLLAPYYASLKEVNKEYDAAKLKFKRLHLGDAELVQEEGEEEE